MKGYNYRKIETLILWHIQKLDFYRFMLKHSINIKDESLGIDWRIPMEKAILSEKDLKHACLKDAVLDFDINDKLY